MAIRSLHGEQSYARAEGLEMKFDIKGIVKGPEELKQFRQEWTAALLAENKAVFGGEMASAAQLFVINLFCGHDDPYREFHNKSTINSIAPAQAEFEALSRARNVALVHWFSRHNGPTESQ